LDSWFLQTALLILAGLTSLAGRKERQLIVPPEFFRRAASAAIDLIDARKALSRLRAASKACLRARRRRKAFDEPRSQS
jgi:hypothetical protein